jgi:hypothetical protein
MESDNATLRLTPTSSIPADARAQLMAFIGIGAFTLTLSLIFQFAILPFQTWHFTDYRRVDITGVGELDYEISENLLTEGQHGVIKVKLTSSEPTFAGEAVESWVRTLGDKEIAYEVTPTRLGRDSLYARVAVRNSRDNSLHGVTLELPVFVSPSLFHRVWLTLIIWLPLLSSMLGVYLWVRARQRREEVQRAKIAEAETKAENATDKARPAWTLAQTKLEAYFDRNLLQVNQVFIVAIAVMIVGFGFVLFGVAISFRQSTVLPISYVASGAGIITQFIGATFMVIYKSTMAQANEFMSVLERINTVGMSVQVLDSIPETDTELKNKSRARIVELLLLANVRSKSVATKPPDKKIPLTKSKRINSIQ